LHSKTWFSQAILGIIIKNEEKKIQNFQKCFPQNICFRQVIFIHLKLWIGGSRATASNE